MVQALDGYQPKKVVEPIEHEDGAHDCAGTTGGTTAEAVSTSPAGAFKREKLSVSLQWYHRWIQ